MSVTCFVLFCFVSLTFAKYLFTRGQPPTATLLSMLMFVELQVCIAD